MGSATKIKRITNDTNWRMAQMERGHLPLEQLILVNLYYNIKYKIRQGKLFCYIQYLLFLFVDLLSYKFITITYSRLYLLVLL